jgi:hypothetical protein
LKTILVIGGYGGFGGRLSRRLLNDGYKLLVGGRSLRKATEFCAGLAHCRPIRIDRGGDITPILLAERPDIVIDAAGPFQQSDYRVIEACLKARIAYIDLADARDFVTGIGRLDDAAKAAGIPVISGASSVPALSHAVVAELAAGLEHVTAIEIAISASSRASAGPSVSEAILGGVGQRVRQWAGQRWQTAYGWQSIGSQPFDLPSGKSLGRRKVAMANVPDLELMPQRHSDVSLVSFRAGTESNLANLILWLASWPVRWGWVGSLTSFAGLLLPAQRLTALWGSDRSGMTVSVFGTSGMRRLERRWTLIAEDGDGPEIPVLAAALLVEPIAQSRVRAGARDAGEELSLADFEPLFAGLSIEHAVTEIAHPPPLYARVMGVDFDRLAPALKSIHGVLRDGGAAGRAVVHRGAHPIARMVAKIMRFPPAGEHELHVHFSEDRGVERWTRDFGGSRFSSSLSAVGSQIVERFGPLRFTFKLSAVDGELAMSMTKWSLGPIRLPNWLAPRSPAREWEADGLFHFDVPIELPLVGRVIRYHGWLDPSSMQPVKNQLGELVTS